ncbi:unnamed protein product [Effrenium voratum]|nr:unnamed protein product [Effrenium voratum]
MLLGTEPLQENEANPKCPSISLKSLNVEVPGRYKKPVKAKRTQVVRFTVESKPFGIAFDTVERDGDVYVVKVTPGSQAECAGIRVGDKLWSAGGRVIRGADQVMSLAQLTPPFKLTFQRDV